MARVCSRLQSNCLMGFRRNPSCCPSRPWANCSICWCARQSEPQRRRGRRFSIGETAFLLIETSPMMLLTAGRSRRRSPSGHLGAQWFFPLPRTPVAAFSFRRTCRTGSPGRASLLPTRSRLSVTLLLALLAGKSSGQFLSGLGQRGVRIRGIGSAFNRRGPFRTRITSRGGFFPGSPGPASRLQLHRQAPDVCASRKGDAQAQCTDGRLQRPRCRSTGWTAGSRAVLHNTPIFQHLSNWPAQADQDVHRPLTAPRHS